MGYYIRTLAIDARHVSVDELETMLAKEGLKARIEVFEGDRSSWKHLELAHFDGTAIADIERNEVSPGSLAEEELKEFAEEVEGQKPASAVQWLKEFFPRVRAIYCFQVLFRGTEKGDGWKILHTLHWGLREVLGGIVQADHEGFSNDDGYHILWQFSDDVKGPFKMAVLNNKGQWEPFEMELGNQEHREEFKAGNVPRGVRRL
jgi:hypothetical protein